MTETNVVGFIPPVQDRLTDQSRAWLAGINASIANGVVTVDASKSLVANLNVLIMPPVIEEQVWSTLASHYGLTPNTSGHSAEIDHHRDIRAAVDLERFDLDPHTAIAEYKAHQWVEELTPFLETPSYARHLDNLRFGVFADAVKTAVAAKKAHELRADLPAWRIRMYILDMQREQQGGFGHSHPFAEEADRKKFISELLASTRRVDGILFMDKDKWDDLLGLFMSTQTAQQLDQSSGIRVLRDSISLGRREVISAANVLIPKEKESPE